MNCFLNVVWSEKMKKEKKVIMIGIGILCVILVISLVVALRSYTKFREQFKQQSEACKETKDTLQFLQQEGIWELISHIKQVMAGEIIYERGSNPLSRYSYNSDSQRNFPTQHTIETDLEVLSINLDGDRGEITASYFIRYLDSSGKKLMFSSSGKDLPVRWMIEKQGEEWIVVEIDEHP